MLDNPRLNSIQSRVQTVTFDSTRARARTGIGWAPAFDKNRMLHEGIGGSLQSWLRAPK
jgi:hypothetical protein